MEHKITVLTNVYNEEYLLPFWLEHHKHMFDHGIIVDYRSTDRSMEICKAICPTWTIITTTNENYGALAVDKEFMELETKIDGIKIVLNTTEFLCSTLPIKHIFSIYQFPISLSINQITVYSLQEHRPSSITELFSNIVKENDIRCTYNRGTRQIHTHSQGNYRVGRHSTSNTTIQNQHMFIFWFGRYPFNPSLEKRMLQIQDNIPVTDIQSGLGIHHLVKQENIYPDIQLQYSKSVPIQELNSNVYDFLLRTYGKQ
jgi:hypothetical protein